MSFNKFSYRKHKLAMDWFYNLNDDTHILFHHEDMLTGEYGLTDAPGWESGTDYIINDDFAEFRKYIYEDKIIQCANNNIANHKLTDSDYNDCSFKLNEYNSAKFFFTKDRYRLKPNNKIEIHAWVKNINTGELRYIETLDDLRQCESSFITWLPDNKEWILIQEGENIVLRQVNNRVKNKLTIYNNYYEDSCNNYEVDLNNIIIEPFNGYLPKLITNEGKR